MDATTVQRVLDHKPFMPCTLGLMGKYKVRLERPDQAKISPDGSCLYVTDAAGLQSAISIMHIATITFDPPAQEPDAVVQREGSGG